MTQLIIAEKPKVAAKIAFSVGKAIKKSRAGVPYYEVDADKKKVIVAPAVGHVFTLQEKGNEKWNLNYPVFDLHWVPIYKVSKSAYYTKKYIDNIKELAQKADEFVNACDYDVEGATIGANVIRLACGVNPWESNVKRMHFSTVTFPDLKRAYENMEPFDAGQTEAGLTRHVLDWYYGINLSRALTSALRKTHTRGTLSIGRVQGPALKLIVDRERDIRKFIPKPYWVISALMDYEKKDFEALHEKQKFWEESEANSVYDKVKDAEKGDVKSVEKKIYHHPAPNPFDLTSLQIEVHRHHGIPPKETLEIGQSLYEAGLISYPRTSSQQLPPAIGYTRILEMLSKQQDYKPLADILLKESYLRPNNGKKVDPAHPAIYPTGERPEGLAKNEWKVYDLIVHRFIATFGKPAVRESIRVAIDVNGETFIAEGKRTVEKNWHILYGKYAVFDEIILPNLIEGRDVHLEKVDLTKKMTQPPKRYSQASIISELEKKNLGTKATRATIIDTLYRRGYIEGTQIQATDFGIQTVGTLEKHSPEILDEQLTREFEEDMEGVIAGKKSGKEIEENSAKILVKILDNFKKDESEIGEELKQSLIKTEEKRIEEESLGKCPECGGELIVRVNPKTRKRFMGCSNYPKCTNTQPLPQKGLIKKAGRDCPECGYPIINVWMKGKKVPWTICTNIKCPTKK